MFSAKKCCLLQFCREATLLGSDGVLQRHMAQRGFPACHVERPRRHDPDEQRCRGMAQPAQQGHRLLPSERIQAGHSSEGGAGAHRIHRSQSLHSDAPTLVRHHHLDKGSTETSTYDWSDYLTSTDRDS